MSNPRHLRACSSWLGQNFVTMSVSLALTQFVMELQLGWPDGSTESLSYGSEGITYTVKTADNSCLYEAKGQYTLDSGVDEMEYDYLVAWRDWASVHQYGSCNMDRVAPRMKRNYVTFTPDCNTMIPSIFWGNIYTRLSGVELQQECSLSGTYVVRSTLLRFCMLQLIFHLLEFRTSPLSPLRTRISPMAKLSSGKCWRWTTLHPAGASSADDILSPLQAGKVSNTTLPFPNGPEPPMTLLDASLRTHFASPSPTLRSTGFASETYAQSWYR